jgi:hypothetical protein
MNEHACTGLPLLRAREADGIILHTFLDSGVRIWGGDRLPGLGENPGVWLNKNSQVSTWYEASRPDQPRLSPQAKRRPRIRNVWRKLVKKREYVVQSWQGLQGPDLKVCYVLADGIEIVLTNDWLLLLLLYYFIILKIML